MGHNGTKRGTIITFKGMRQDWSLKAIADELHYDYGYVRKVMSQHRRRSAFARGRSQSRRGPYPALRAFGGPQLRVQKWWLFCQVPTGFYDRCPVVPAKNRNRQKSYGGWSGAPFSFRIFPYGKAYVWPYFGEEVWRPELRKWLGSWLQPDEVSSLMSGLEQGGLMREIAMSAPGILQSLPKGFRLKIGKVGSVSVDTTPFRRGTLEYQVDVGAQKQLNGVTNAVAALAEQIKAHLFAIKELGEAARLLREEVEQLRKQREGAQDTDKSQGSHSWGSSD